MIGCLRQHGVGERGVPTNASLFSLGDIENVIKLIVAMVAQLCKILKAVGLYTGNG